MSPDTQETVGGLCRHQMQMNLDIKKWKLRHFSFLSHLSCCLLAIWDCAVAVFWDAGLQNRSQQLRMKHNFKERYHRVFYPKILFCLNHSPFRMLLVWEHWWSLTRRHQPGRASWGRKEGIPICITTAVWGYVRHREGTRAAWFAAHSWSLIWTQAQHTSSWAHICACVQSHCHSNLCHSYGILQCWAVVACWRR